jgi:alpha/beta superfamily hydrolase
MPRPLESPMPCGKNAVRLPLMKNSKKIAVVAGITSLLWLGLTAAVGASQRKLVFNAGFKRNAVGRRSKGHRTRAVVFRTKDGTKLSGWLMTPVKVDLRGAVIYFGGRSEDVSWVARDAERMFAGMTVLVVDYRGYGKSQGIPGEAHIVDDARMLFDWMAQRDHVDPAKIAVLGRSLGSGVAVQVATQRPVHSLVLITPYDSILAIARKRFRAVPVGFVLRHKFESIKYAAMLTAPTYVLRSAFDDVVPHSHTDLLVAKLTSLYLDETIPDSDHFDIPHLTITQDKIANFLRAQFLLRPDQLVIEASDPVLAAVA